MSGMITTSLYNGEFLIQTVNLSQEFLSDILYDIQSTADLDYRKEIIWNRRVTKLTSDISQFVELTTLLSKTLMLKTHKTVPAIKESHLSLLYILKAMNQARINQDYAALEELIKYELQDNLTQWKIDLIPQIKKVLNT